MEEITNVSMAYDTKWSHKFTHHSVVMFLWQYPYILRNSSFITEKSKLIVLKYIRANLAEWWWTDWHDLLLPDSQLANESLETITSYNCPLDTRMHPGYYNCASCTSRVYHMIIMNRPFSTWGTFYGYQGGSNSLALFNTSTWQGQAHVVWGTDTCLYRFLTLQTQHVQYVSEVKTPYWFKTHRLSRPWQNATAPLGRKGDE